MPKDSTPPPMPPPPRRTTPPSTRERQQRHQGVRRRRQSRPRPMIRILQRQWTISSIIFNFPSSGDFSFSNKQTGTTLVTHRPVIFGSLSFHFSFSLSASFEPLPTFFSLFNFSTDLTDSGPLREQNSQGGLWESREVQQQTGHLLSSHAIFKHSTKCQSPGEWKICALS